MSTKDSSRQNGWVMFAAIMMFTVGFVRIISAFTYFDNSATTSGPPASGISSSPGLRSSAATRSSAVAGSEKFSLTSGRCS